MAADSTRKFGAYWLIVFLLFWIYYTMWVLLVPLFDDDVLIVQFFPPREYAILFISLCGWLLIIVLSGFIGLVIILNSFSKSTTLQNHEHTVSKELKFE
jgi:dolichyl-phosphate mannosyltransferase polypeptide 2 regulatory subunit